MSYLVDASTWVSGERAALVKLYVSFLPLTGLNQLILSSPERHRHIRPVDHRRTRICDGLRPPLCDEHTRRSSGVHIHPGCGRLHSLYGRLGTRCGHGRASRRPRGARSGSRTDQRSWSYHRPGAGRHVPRAERDRERCPPALNHPAHPLSPSAPPFTPAHIYAARGAPLLCITLLSHRPL